MKRELNEKIMMISLNRHAYLKSTFNLQRIQADQCFHLLLVGLDFQVHQLDLEVQEVLVAQNHPVGDNNKHLLHV